MKLKIYCVLDDIKDKTFVYSVLLNKAHSYYGRLKTFFKLPIIVTSSVMSIMNSNFTGDDNALRIVNIIFNLITALTLSFATTLKFEEKHQNFLSAEKKFLKLQSIVEQKMIDDTEISSDFINTIMNQYDNIVDGIDFDIPSHILKNVRTEYATKKTLPIIINGIAKAEEYRMSHFNNSLKKITIDTPLNGVIADTKMNSNIIFEKKNEFRPRVHSPRVIETKPFSFDVPLEKIEGLQL